MIGRLNHVAIAVKDLHAAAAVYRDTLGATVSEAVPQPEHGVSTIFITLPNTKIELLEPLGANSPIAKFLERNAEGGVHHICYEVDDIEAASKSTCCKRRAHPGRREAENRRAWQTRSFPPSQGLLRDARRTRTKVKGREHLAGDRALCDMLVDRSVRHPPAEDGGGTSAPRKRSLRRSRRCSERAKTEAQVPCDDDCFGGDRRRALCGFRLRADSARQPALHQPLKMKITARRRLLLVS